jgi:hypothetical protein
LRQNRLLRQSLKSQKRRMAFDTLKFENNFT